MVIGDTRSYVLYSVLLPSSSFLSFFSPLYDYLSLSLARSLYPPRVHSAVYRWMDQIVVGDHNMMVVNVESQQIEKNLET